MLLCALLSAPACQIVALNLGGAVRFGFEGDAVGVAPAGLTDLTPGWHARVESGQAASGSRSVRLFAQQDIQRSRSGDLSIRLDATSLRGRIVRVSGALRVEESAADSSSMRLFVRVERGGGAVGLDDAMEDAPVHATEWADVELVGAVAADATWITFGARVRGPGPFHLDELSIETLRSLGPSDPSLLDRVTTRQLSNPDVQVMRVKSELLSRFFGRDVSIDVGVIVPSDGTSPDTAACYHIADFGGTWAAAYTEGSTIAASMRGKYPRMLYVWLDGTSTEGHLAFADSVNDGPWGEALVNEIMPAIETRFLAGRAPRCRYVTGHGSGGWSSLWLQIAYPHLFNGAWATGPDPVDFRAFQDVDIYTARSFKSGAETAGRGAQLAHFESQFSPRGFDGRPMLLCDRRSGAIDPAVAQAWRKYDIGVILNERWSTLGSKLAGRLHVWCGERDGRGRASAVRMLGHDLARLSAEADVLLVEGRDHGNLAEPHADLWPMGMRARIHREMAMRTSTLVRP